MAVLCAGIALLLASTACTVEPPIGGSADLPDGTGSISIDQGPIGSTGFCLPSVFALSYVAQDTPTAFILTITASPSLCETVNPIAAIYAMPEGATNILNAWPQKLAARTPFTITGPGVTTVTFHKGCLPAQFDVLTGETPPVINFWGGPFHGPMLFPWPWTEGSAGLWFGSDCGGTGDNCEDYTPTNLSVEPSSVAAGGSITVAGSGTPGTTIEILLQKPPASPVATGASIVVGPDGHWSVPVTVPDDLDAGTWQVVARVKGCDTQATADLTVTDDDGAVEPTPEPEVPTPPQADNGQGGSAPTDALAASSTQPLPVVAVESANVTNSSPTSSSAQPAGLAFTGSTVRLPVLIGLALLVAGALLLLKQRRRRS